MLNYVDLIIVHTQVASQLKGVKLELKELKARSLLLGACLKYPKLKLELDARSLKVEELETKLLGQHWPSPPWTGALSGPQMVDRVHRIFPLKNNFAPENPHLLSN